MPLWGATDADESKPKNLTTAEKKQVFANASGWVLEAGSPLSGNGNTIPHEDTTPSSVEEGAAWTKKSGKNPSGGLNETGRKSYERDNPGSDLKRPSKKVGNKRRASFCA